MDVTEVDVPPLPLDRFRPLIGDERYEHLTEVAAGARELLDGRTVWNINSTATGGGVAEMLQVLVGYTRGAGLDVRWLVVPGDPQFFGITKRLHNRLHGTAGDDGALGTEEAIHYERVTASNAGRVDGRVKAGDVVILHDPQPAGLAAFLKAIGAHVIWRCHIGTEHPNEWSQQAWQFLLPHVASCDRFVFSLESYVPEGIPMDRTAIIPPSIDPFSAKNQDLEPDVARAIVNRIGLFGTDGHAPVTYRRRDGGEGRVERTATIVGDGPLDPDVPLVVQVSRWDHLKDMQGVLRGFADHVAGRVPAALALVGPSVEGVSDDPEGAAVLKECEDAWRALAPETRACIRLVSLPMNDVDENAAMVNALQRVATVVTQKSIREGFGLTVAEAMWKAKPVVASAVGGIVEQVVEGTGILLDDANDLEAFGTAVRELVSHPDEVRRLGDRARAHVLDQFVGDRHLMAYGAVIRSLIDPE